MSNDDKKDCDNSEVSSSKKQKLSDKLSIEVIPGTSQSLSSRSSNSERPIDAEEASGSRCRLYNENTNSSSNSSDSNPEDLEAIALLQWQERQISKCIVDNTVNRVVESYLVFFDAENEQTIPFQRENHGFEECAIASAINHFGLHQNNENNSDMEHNNSQSRDNSDNMTVLLPRLLPTVVELDNSTENITDQSIHEPNTRSESIIPVIITPPQNNMDGTSESEHFDFMEAAVSAAIQKKGLITMSPNR